MNILVAPNSMKGSLSAFDFANTVEEALLKYSPLLSIRKVPVADGGDFTGEVLAKAFHAEKVEITVCGPLGKKVKSQYFISGETAIIEMADASGMKLVEKKDLNPLTATSYGTGELIADAVSKNCKKIFLAVGGSATVDGGMGMLNAFGIRFFDQNGTELPGNGENLEKVVEIISPESFPEVSIKIICDVDNPLLGETGAAAVFGPQKGATPEMVIRLEKGLKNWAEILQKKTGKKIFELPGAGAAGGVSAGLISFFDAEIVPGADFVLSKINFGEHMKWADLVITGEGKIDSQTLNNKAPFAVARRARKLGKPVVAIGGQVDLKTQAVFDFVFSTGDNVEIEYAIKNARQLLFDFTLKNAGEIEKLTQGTKNER